MTSEKITGQELVLGFLRTYRKLSSVRLSVCAIDSGRILAETASRRMRELTLMPNLVKFGYPDYRIVSRKITAGEMQDEGLKTRVQMHELVRVRKEPEVAQPTLMDIRPRTDTAGVPILLGQG